MEKFWILGMLAALSMGLAGNIPEAQAETKKKAPKNTFKVGDTIKVRAKPKVDLMPGNSALIHVNLKEQQPLAKHGMVWTDRECGNDLANFELEGREVTMKFRVTAIITDESRGMPHTVCELLSYSVRP